MACGKSTVRRLNSLALMLLVCVVAIAPAAHAQLSACGPMDVTFVIDNTGSMAQVNAEVQAQVARIADAVVTASGNDYQFGLVALPRNDVVVLLDMSVGNRAALSDATELLVNEGSCGTPAVWDEGLNTVINNLGPRTGTAGQQIGNFTGRWRDEASKVIILITDTDPSGLGCEFEEGVHDVAAFLRASQAVGRDIAITSIYVPTGGGSDPDEVRAILQRVAAISGGVYKETLPDASDLSDVIVDVVEVCGQASALRITPDEVALRNGESSDFFLTNYRPRDLTTLVYTSSGLPPDSTVTFERLNPAIEGTDLLRMHVTIGPDTPAGTYLVLAEARHTDRSRVDSVYVLVHVDCKPPGILGTSQPQTQVVPRGSTATFTVGASGSGRFSYQWYEGYRGMTRTPIAGATGPTFTTPAVNFMNSYWVRVTSVCGSDDSLTAYAIPQ